MRSLEVTEESTKSPTQKSQRSYQHKHKVVISPHVTFSNYNSSRRAFNSGPTSLLENDLSKMHVLTFLIGVFYVQVVLQRDA